MRPLTRLMLALAVLTVGGAGAAQAQTRDGFFVGVGLGWGSAAVETDDLGSSDRQGSVTANLRVGTSLSHRLLFGAELNGWFDSENGDNVSLFNTTAAFYYYPADSGLFLKAGAGLSRADFEVLGESLSGIGWGVMAGVGYDFPIGDSTAVTPMATYWYGKPGTLTLDDVDTLTGFKHNVFEIGVGFTFY